MRGIRSRLSIRNKLHNLESSRTGDQQTKIKGINRKSVNHTIRPPPPLNHHIREILCRHGARDAQGSQGGDSLWKGNMPS